MIDQNQNILNATETIRIMEEDLSLQRDKLMEHIEQHIINKINLDTMNCGIFKALYYYTLGRFFHPDKYLLICKVIQVIELQKLKSLQRA